MLYFYNLFYFILFFKATIENIPVEHKENHIIICDQKFLETTPTCFKSISLKVEGGYYTIRDLVFFLENIETSLIEYRTKAQKLGIIPVVIQDKADLTRYLHGDVEICPQINREAMKSATGFNHTYF